MVAFIDWSLVLDYTAALQRFGPPPPHQDTFKRGTVVNYFFGIYQS